MTSLQASPESADKTLRGILLVVTAVLMAPVMNGIAKELGGRYSVFEVTWGRYFFHLLLMLPFLVRQHGWKGFIPPHAGLQVFRSSLLLISTCFFFAALAMMPFADTQALSFVYPLVVTALAPFVLQEHVGLRRWIAVGVGFLGALIIIRPGFSGIDLGGSVFALAAGGFYAAYLVATRRLSRTAPPLVTLAFTALVGLAGLTVVLPFVWATPTLIDFGLMVVMGAVAAVTTYMLICAHVHAPASILAPFGYTEMIGAVSIGFLVFGDLPDSWTWVGIAVIVGSGLYISIRERKRGVALAATDRSVTLP